MDSPIRLDVLLVRKQTVSLGRRRRDPTKVTSQLLESLMHCCVGGNMTYLSCWTGLDTNQTFFQKTAMEPSESCCLGPDASASFLTVSSRMFTLVPNCLIQFHSILFVKGLFGLSGGCCRQQNVLPSSSTPLHLSHVLYLILSLSVKITGHQCWICQFRYSEYAINPVLSRYYPADCFFSGIF